MWLGRRGESRAEVQFWKFRGAIHLKGTWEFTEWSWGWRTLKKTQKDKKVHLGNTEESVGVRI